jgi:DNA-directed RNA polymerase specialized sigma subunit
MNKDWNSETYQRIIAGDASAQDELIEGNLGLVVAYVLRAINEFPKYRHLQEDINSEARLGLVLAVRNIPRDIRDVTDYLSWAIRHAIGNFLDSEGVIPIPARTLQVARKEERELVKPRVASDVHEQEIATANPMDVLELREQIMSCAKNDLELRILELLELGNSPNDVAEQLNMAVYTVWLLRREIYERFLLASGMDGEA